MDESDDPNGAGLGVGPSVGRFSPQVPARTKDPHVIAYRAMLDVPCELIARVSRLLAVERRRLGTRPGTRALTCRREALLGSVWFRKHEEMTALAVSFGISRATACRYRDEVVRVLDARAPRPAPGAGAGR